MSGFILKLMRQNSKVRHSSAAQPSPLHGEGKSQPERCSAGRGEATVRYRTLSVRYRTKYFTMDCK